MDARLKHPAIGVLRCSKKTVHDTRSFPAPEPESIETMNAEQRCGASLVIVCDDVLSLAHETFPPRRSVPDC
jgi:hypothetical protein